MSKNAPIVTRFAPSPTGYLHIGGARTALFNLLFARRFGGTLILRIDDTDRERSTQAAVDAILTGLEWLGIGWDQGPIYQHQRIDRHVQVAHQLLAEGKAYRCYCTPEELEAMREKALKLKRPPRYDGNWRDRDPAEAPAGVAPSIRIRAPRSGVVPIEDAILGRIEFSAADLDDFVLLRADGSPTYMLSTVVDDHDLGVTHVIRGNDHLTNAARQAVIIDALGWPRPVYAHIPLIHGMDGAKLSKRHGAVGIDAFAAQGLLPEAMLDYLSRLGWHHGDEFLTLDQMAERFDLAALSRSPARFDQDLLTHVNFHYMKQADDARLAREVLPFLAPILGAAPDPATAVPLLTAAMPGLKERAKTLVHLAETCAFYLCRRPIPIEADAAALLDGDARARLAALVPALAAVAEWSHDPIAAAIKAKAADLGLGFAKLGQPLRAALTGRTNSPGVAEVMALLGREEALGRIEDALRA